MPSAARPISRRQRLFRPASLRSSPVTASPRSAPPWSNSFHLCRFMALSWPNLPYALKPAVGDGKRTLSDPAASRRRPWLLRTPSVVSVAPQCKILARHNKTGRHVFAYVPDAEGRPWRPLASPLAARGRSLCRRRAAVKIPLFVAVTAVVLLATGACWN